MASSSDFLNLNTEVLAAHSSAIYAVHYRLARCWAQVQARPSNNRMDSCHLDKVRLLGVLSRNAVELADKVSVASAQAAAARKLKTASLEDPTVAQDELISTDSQRFYNQQLRNMFSSMVPTMKEAEVYLKQQAHSPFALALVGAVPSGTLKATSGVQEPIYVYDDYVPIRSRVIPAADVHAIHCTADNTISSQKRVIAQEQRVDKQKSSSSMGLPAPSATATSAEDAVMDDIKNAIAQMKNGALHMGELLRGEEGALRESERLLSDGVDRARSGTRDVDKLAAAHGVSGWVPGVVRAVPGGEIAWRTVVLPLWAVVKQALAMSLIIAVTGVMVMLMVIASKPRTFRAIS